jgi:hypothetical protein
MKHYPKQDTSSDEPARRLFAAAISSIMGVSLSCAYDKVKGRPIGAYWLALAPVVLEQAYRNIQPQPAPSPVVADNQNNRRRRDESSA